MERRAEAEHPISPDELKRADTLYEQGLYVQSYEVLRPYGQPEA